MSISEEIAGIVEQLPPNLAQSVLDFARFLAEKYDDEEWEKRLSTAHLRPKFRALVEKAEREIAEGKSIPMDFENFDN